MLIAGIDEAGRGSIIGPLVIAYVIVKEEDLSLLRSLGVKDSKMLSKKKRSTLANEIEKIAHKIVVRELSAREIDNRSTLNKLELNAIIELIDRARSDFIYIDSFDVKTDRLEKIIAESIEYDATIHASHKADRDNLVVSAASIIAKVNRDNAIEKLRCYGSIGSGYPSDPYTREFVANCMSNNFYPEFIRYSWKSVKNILQLPLHDPYQKVLD
ncbi:MAG: ribonuclease HII [Candidatus Nitrosocaldaceae archaeon]